ncbi:hypothetical protein B0I37DRAFT_365260 [Chaetomium sp. MPI-CAGE-AT-0009]|nr:hypothetical protein B0I37DRAFT_365260 [Chaetomium sp. MPI-CAGE-AT-0009]
MNLRRGAGLPEPSGSTRQWRTLREYCEPTYRTSWAECLAEAEAAGLNISMQPSIDSTPTGRLPKTFNHAAAVAGGGGGWKARTYGKGLVIVRSAVFNNRPSRRSDRGRSTALC